jgi:excisionase family DNA binding protein
MAKGANTEKSNKHLPRTVSVETAARILGISRGAGYNAARAGQIPCIKIGKRLLVPKALLEKMVPSV